MKPILAAGASCDLYLEREESCWHRGEDWVRGDPELGASDSSGSGHSGQGLLRGIVENRRIA